MFSIGMMLKNEEEYLDFCLKNLGLSLQTITVIDTGSTDTTKVILENHSIAYMEEAFNGYSNIRNLILKRSNTEYVLMLDGDETIVDKGLECDYSKAGYVLNRCHYLGNGSVYFDQTMRLFRNEPGILYENDIFEGINLNIQNVSYLDVLIHHFGYLKSTFQNKMIVNLEKIQEDRKKNERSVHYSMEALYLILQNKIDDAVEIIERGESRFQNIWFYILKSDIYKAQRDYLSSNLVLEEAKAFCKDTMSVPIYNFYLSRIVLKQTILAICQSEFEKAIELLSHVEKPLE